VKSIHILPPYPIERRHLVQDVTPRSENLLFFTLAQLKMLFKAPIDGERVSMKIEQAKQFLRAYEHGGNLEGPGYYQRTMPGGLHRNPTALA
jgi:hypothetical protein